MSYTAIITDPHEADAMPMWESFGRADVDDALRVAQTFIHATQPGDRIVESTKGGASTQSGPALRPRHESPPSSSHQLTITTPGHDRRKAHNPMTITPSNIAAPPASLVAA